VRLSIDASKEKQKELVKEAETEKQVREQALKQLIAEGKTRDELGVTEMKRLSDSYQEKRRLEDEYDDLISRSTKTEYDYEVDRIQKEGEARKREAKDRGTLTSDNLTDINNITEVKLHELQVKWHQASEGIRVDWLTMTLNIEDSFVTGLADSLTHLKTWKQAGLDVLGDFEKEAEKIFAKLIQEALDWYLFAPTGSGFNWANVLKSAAPGITGAAATTTAVTGAVAGTTVAAGAVPVVEVGAGPGALAGAPKAPWWQGMVPGGNVPTSGVIYNGEQLTWQESQQLWDLLFGKLGGAEQENPIHKDTAGPEVWDPGVLTVVDGSGGGDTITGLRQGTGGEYWDFGAGTPVILHGLEAVVPQSDQPTIHGTDFTLAGGPSAPAGPIVLQINLDGKVLARNQYDNLLALFTERGVFSGS
jgi:phage host-nuclease inhibitor protein Gam